MSVLLLPALLAALASPARVATRVAEKFVQTDGGRIYVKVLGAQWHVFERSSHLPFYEEPDEFVRVMNEFFGAP